MGVDIMSDDAKKVITFEEAINLLPEGAMVHTFRQVGPVLLGADWERDSIIEAMRSAVVEETGPAAQAMHHGLAILEGGRYLFIATK